MSAASVAFFTLCASVGIASILFPSSLHTVDEGHIGLYWRGGALLDRVTEPGYHFKLPLIDSFAQVQVTMQTDLVRNIPCGTSGGTMISFDKIEVVNRLKKERAHEIVKEYTVNYDRTWIFDKVHHEINQFCSGSSLREIYIEKFQTVDDLLAKALQESVDKYAPGIEIISVRVTKPVIPRNILKNFEIVEEEKARLMIAKEQARIAEVEAATEQRKRTIEAETKRSVSEISMKQAIAEKEAAKTMDAIQNEQHLARQKALADAEHYQYLQQAKSNELLLTENYVKLELARSVANNTKVYFGPSLNSMFLDLFSSFATGEKISSSNKVG